jgi:hypothetical protein
MFDDLELVIKKIISNISPLQTGEGLGVRFHLLK